MSYILDALQRAEAERERGRVPDITSQLAPPLKQERASSNAQRVWQAMLFLAALAIGLGIWRWTSAPDSNSAISGLQTTMENPATGTTATATLPTPLPAASTSIAAGIPSTEPALPILAPPRQIPAAPTPAAANAALTMPPSSAATSSGSTSLAPASTTPLPAVPTFGELTAEARSRLPAVNVSGSTFSQNPALRMLIANGKVVQEGQDIAPGLRLESIGPRNAVLNHQGMRYSIGY